MRAVLTAAIGLISLILAAALSLSGTAAAPAGVGARPYLANATPTGYEHWRGVLNLYNQGPGCTGVLIDPQVVLASGHCTTGFITNPTQVLIAGGADLRDPDQVLPYAVVTEVAVPPGFEQGDWMADIALLRLNQAVVGVPYYGLHLGARPTPVAGAKVVGYGATAKGLADHGVHREGDVWITDPFLGDPEFNRRLVIFTGPTMVCHGDSGAPVFFAAEDEWRVLALSVRTDSCEPDGLGFAVYLRPYRDWLATVVRAWTGHEPPEQGGIVPGTPGPAVTATPLPPVTATATTTPTLTFTPTTTATATAPATPTPGPVYLPWSRRE